jgi:hypothetical protein
MIAASSGPWGRIPAREWTANRWPAPDPELMEALQRLLPPVPLPDVQEPERDAA